MDSWTAHTAPPNIKFEDSPAESLLSTPDEMYPSLFGSSSESNPTVNPIDMLTPQSIAGDKQPDLTLLAGLTALTQTALTPTTLAAPHAASTAPAPEPEKKPVKKRKSWGQVLPEPKTNLPPRKRAKTEDEKEQRRVERVLRNRRAAQSSRERKRLEVEALERRNKELEAALLQAQQINFTLLEEIQKFRQGAGVVSRAAPSFDALRQNPVTFSQQLFGSQDGHGAPISGASSLEQLLQSIPSAVNNKTVNPASLSPALSPIPEAAEEQKQPATVATPVAEPPATSEKNASADTTQHPAAMLCQDLQCRSAEAAPSTWLAASQQPLHPVVSLLLPLQLLLASTSAMLSVCQRPLMQIAMSLKAGFSLRPTRAITNTIIWLVTTPHRSPSRTRPTNSTSTSSSPTASSTPRPAANSSRSSSPAAPSQTRPSSLRLRTLRKILTCSPTLARPLMDATMEALRLASSEGCSVDRVSGGDVSAAAAAGGEAQKQLYRRGLAGWPTGAALPSKEALLTLLWVLRVEERRLQIREQVLASSKPGTLSVPKSTAPTVKTTSFVLAVSRKRSREEENDVSEPRRRRCQ
ncbi:uncharacterized protein THITE_2111320 [Thermothielavioides terrestris NRRL 8126]|uniref:BZIP domain-containing protein n=1 Tax=Thermothielavioides terrestris (strain ATCC 38088 / NRRL 8126) TaxID=578455 RepID=G2R1U8_THETT|nr:uncharacterized protein THITE_2111320 [Thermothielavioides terrestris NRRL 8126]AEO64924.1 hypothetical protein THITE_2111320 [Thermothielavioides terrestris NRRL 8126]